VIPAALPQVTLCQQVIARIHRPYLQDLWKPSRHRSPYRTAHCQQ
jgi:hypothetical protein